MKHIVGMISGIVVLTAALTFLITKQFEPEQSAQVNVDGQCLKKVSPDKGQVTFDISVLQPQAEVASDQAQKIYQNLVDAVKKLNLKDLELQTTNYRVDREYEWTGSHPHETQTLKGYRAIMGISVQTTDIKRLGEAMKLSTQFAFVEAGAFSTFVSSEKFKQEREGCLMEAITNAREKASKMAKAGGAKLGKMIGVSEAIIGGRGLAMGMVSETQMFSKALIQEQSSPVIETKDQDLNVKVDVTFSLK